MAEPETLDEPADRWFARPVARPLVRLLGATPIRPMHLTVLAALAGAAAGVALFFEMVVLFAALLAAMLVLDCADGQLARRQGAATTWGRIADGFGDYVTGLACHAALFAWLLRDHGVGGLLVGLAAGAGMSWCSFLLDRAKRRYLSTTDDVAEVQAVAEGPSLLRRTVARLFLPYARQLSAGEVVDVAEYRRRLSRPVRLWTWLGPTSHYAVWVVAILLGGPLAYAVVAAGPMNAIAAGTALWQRRLERATPPVIRPT